MYVCAWVQKVDVVEYSVYYFTVGVKGKQVGKQVLKSTA